MLYIRQINPNSLSNQGLKNQNTLTNESKNNNQNEQDYHDDQFTLIDDNILESEENDNFMDTLCFDDMTKIKQWYKDTGSSNTNMTTIVQKKGSKPDAV